MRKNTIFTQASSLNIQTKLEKRIKLSKIVKASTEHIFTERGYATHVLRTSVEHAVAKAISVVNSALLKSMTYLFL